jgi:hypothetical protein
MLRNQQKDAGMITGKTRELKFVVREAKAKLRGL